MVIGRCPLLLIHGYGGRYQLRAHFLAVYLIPLSRCSGLKLCIQMINLFILTVAFTWFPSYFFIITNSILCSSIAFVGSGYLDLYIAIWRLIFIAASELSVVFPPVFSFHMLDNFSYRGVVIDNWISIN